VSTSSSYLPPGLPAPVPARDGLDAPYWEAASQHRLVAQRCRSCRRWQWGPEWLCHRCHSFEVAFEAPPGPAVIYSWERPWHPVHPVLATHGPYIVALVELPEADGIRMVGNLVGDPTVAVSVGAEVVPHFEDHLDDDPPFTLVHWRFA
jgi:hypothetical protein